MYTNILMSGLVGRTKKGKRILLAFYLYKMRLYKIIMTGQFIILDQSKYFELFWIISIGFESKLVQLGADKSIPKNIKNNFFVFF